MTERLTHYRESTFIIKAEAQEDEMDTPHPDTDKNRSLALLAKDGIRLFYSKLLQPKSITEDERRREFMLNVMIIGSITLLSLLDLSLLYNALVKGSSFAGASVWKFSLLIALFGVLYVISRKGQVKLASAAVVLLYFAGTTASTYSWGVSLPANLLGYALVITISSVLISSWFGLLTSVASFGALMAIGLREISEGVLPAWKAEMITQSDITAYSIILLLIALISWLSNRETEYSLKRARQSEADLVLEKGSLEEKIRERTSDLMHAQVDRMAQLSRFAEFGRLSSGLFHDLISPLSAIGVNLQGIEGTDHPEIHAIKDQLQRAVKASKRMDTFISSIKKQVRVDELREHFSPNDIIEEAVTLFHYKAARAGIMIDFSADQELSAFGNPIKFHQILSNLISNAIDAYGPANFRRKTIFSTREVTVRLKKHRDHLIITVKDEGEGIPPDVMPHIFEPFFTTKSREVSMGLGLSTTKEIVEKEFGGTIRVASRVGSGTTFTVTMPRNRHLARVSKES